MVGRNSLSRVGKLYHSHLYVQRANRDMHDVLLWLVMQYQLLLINRGKVDAGRRADGPRASTMQTNARQTQQVPHHTRKTHELSTDNHQI